MLRNGLIWNKQGLKGSVLIRFEKSEVKSDCFQETVTVAQGWKNANCIILT
jgi:hypothetical protein